MSQFDFGTIDPNSKSGPQLALDLNKFRDALNSSHRGSARPAYAQAGMLWVRETSSTQWDLMFFDGDADFVLRSVNPQTNQLLPMPFTQVSGLGTSATADLTIGSTDTTPERALKVADFGLGGSPAADTADPDALKFSCFFRAFNSAKMPTVAAYSGIHIQREPGNARAAQIIWSDAPFEQYSRARSGSGVWSAWSKPYSNTNTSSFIQALLDDPDDATARATLGIVEPLGRNQTWQNVTGARAANTNYTNTTGRTIAVVFTASSGAITDYFIDSQPVARSNVPAGGTPVTALIVPAGSTYSIGGGFYLWWELR